MKHKNISRYHSNQLTSYLVCDSNKDGEQKDIHLPVVRFSYLFWSVTMELVRHMGQKRNNHGKVVPVRLNKVVPGDGRRINMVLTKWPDKSL